MNVKTALLTLVAAASGLGIAYMDSRPGFDDTGITAGLLLIAAGCLGSAAPQRPWLWALMIGLWIPLHAIASQHSVASLGMLLVLAFPFAGAYAGTALRTYLG